MNKKVSWKVLIACGAGALCVGVLACTLLWSNKTPGFQPEGQGTLSQSENQSEPIVVGDATQWLDGIVSQPNGESQKESPNAGYPKVVEKPESTEGGAGQDSQTGDVEIQFTNPNPPKSTPPASSSPVTAPNHASGEKPTTPPVETPKPADVPQTNTSGQVYDPAFGWITPSAGSGQVVDSTGDPNKMVGSMD